MSAVAPSPTGERDVHPGVARVAAFAPAGYEEDPERQARAARYFERHRCRFAASAGVVDRRFAASDRERLAELVRVASDPTVDVAIALRGGYGATRLLPALDWRALAAGIAGNGKRLVGHSDFTAIQLGLLANAGTPTLAGPMVGPDFGAPAIDPFMEEHFWRAVDESRVAVSFETDHAPLAVRGTLWGGNLTMLASLVGTPWMPAIDGGVLFVEDVNERPYRIERMLLQLAAAGILGRQRLVLAGAFSGYRPLDYDNGYDVDAALDHVRSVVATPIVAGLPFGHVPAKATLAVGVPVDVRVDRGRCTVAQRW